MENPEFKFIDLKNPDAQPSYKFDASSPGVKATSMSFLDHINGLYQRDQLTKKPDLTSGKEVQTQLKSANSRIKNVSQRPSHMN